MGAAQEESEQIVGVDLTPLVHVVLVLSVVCMVTAGALRAERLAMDLPKWTGCGGEPRTVPVVVAVVSTDQVYVDGVELTEAAAIDTLRAAVAREASVRAYVAPHPSLTVSEVRRLVAQVQATGVQRVKLFMQRPTP